MKIRLKQNLYLSNEEHNLLIDAKKLLDGIQESSKEYLSSYACAASHAIDHVLRYEDDDIIEAMCADLDENGGEKMCQMFT